ncbi:MAG: glutathione synthase [Candidatus Gastranaerophilales bacterium]|nr:glutathione synthase [Candidatus Gastranaerophilales bacterium]
MNKFKIVYVIDKVELRYFEFNDLVTSFWLIKECNHRDWDVYITTMDRLSLRNNLPEALVFKTSLKNSADKVDMVYDKKAESICLNEFDCVVFRPDPPVNMDYIFATYILDYVDTSRTTLINSPSGIRKANEKLYINNFQGFIPDNLTTSNAGLIKEFLDQHNEIILKPLNKCFGKGVFYLKKGDKNINAILESSTNNGTTVVMAQKYLPEIKNGDKRLIIIGGELYNECVIKLSGEDDFKFNNHRDEYFKKGFISDEQREMCKIISPKLLEDGLYFVGLDVIDNMIIEINVTSPCFFIREINNMFGVNLEKRVVDYMESLLCRKKQLVLTSI